MATNREQCPSCGQWYRNLSSHYAKNAACQNVAMNRFRVTIPTTGMMERPTPPCSEVVVPSKPPNFGNPRLTTVRSGVRTSKRSRDHSVAFFDSSKKRSREDSPPGLHIQRSKDSGQSASSIEGEFEFPDDNRSFDAIQEGAIGCAHGSYPTNTVNGPTVEAADTTSPVVNHQAASGTLEDPKSIKALGLSFNLCIGATTSFTFPRQLNESIMKKTTPSQRVQATIHHMCHKAGAPRYLAADILSYLQEQLMKKRIDFHDSKTLIQPDKLMLGFQNALGIEPLEALPITLESGFRTTVFRFHIKDMMQRHLLSHAFADMENINLPVKGLDDPFSYDPTRKLPLDYTDLNNGHWYKAAVNKYNELLCGGEHILHPWVLYGDKTGVDQVEKNSLEPIAISSSNLTRSVRETASIPNLKSLHKERSRSTTTNSRSIACLFATTINACCLKF